MNIPDINVPIIKNGNSELVSLRDEFDNKKIVLFGIPGAFTPTCSEEHFPGYIKLYDKIISKGVNDIYCLSVNDKYVMKSWLRIRGKVFISPLRMNSFTQSTQG